MIALQSQNMLWETFFDVVKQVIQILVPNSILPIIVA